MPGRYVVVFFTRPQSLVRNRKNPAVLLPGLVWLGGDVRFRLKVEESRE